MNSISTCCHQFSQLTGCVRGRVSSGENHDGDKVFGCHALAIWTVPSRSGCRTPRILC